MSAEERVSASIKVDPGAGRIELQYSAPEGDEEAAATVSSMVIQRAEQIAYQLYSVLDIPERRSETSRLDRTLEILADYLTAGPGHGPPPGWTRSTESSPSQDES